MPTASASPARIPIEAYILGVALFFIVAATNILTPLLPDIRKDFGVSIAAAGIVVGAYGFARLVTDLPAGFLIDAIGHRRISLAALVLLVLSCVIGWNAGSIEILIAARIAGGVSVSILATVLLSSLGAIATDANRGKVMSFFHVANNVGIALYPLLGGVIGAALGWRATFLATLGLAVVASALLLPVLLRLRPTHERAGRSRSGEERVLPPRQRLAAILATDAGVVANFINRHGFRNTVLPLYAATSLGLGGLSIATAIALMSATGLAVATPGGALGDRIGRRRIIVTGLAALAVGDIVFLLTHDLVTFLAASALIGFGDFFSSSQTALLSEVVPAAQRTRVLSTYRFSADLGAFIGPVLLAAVMDLSSAQIAITLAAAILVIASLAARLGVPSLVDARRVLVPQPVAVVGVGDGSE
jgi:MFS family permease